MTDIGGLFICIWCKLCYGNDLYFRYQDDSSEKLKNSKGPPLSFSCSDSHASDCSFSNCNHSQDVEILCESKLCNCHLPSSIKAFALLEKPYTVIVAPLFSVSKPFLVCKSIEHVVFTMVKLILPRHKFGKCIQFDVVSTLLLRCSDVFSTPY